MFNFRIIGLLLVGLVLSLSAIAQKDDIRRVTATGQGENKETALQDALRNAVAQAAGIAVQSTTRVENFVTVQDAIATNTSGYIADYKVVSERKMSDLVSITVDAGVSMKPLAADAGLLARSIGGVRFLVTFDERGHDKKENDHLEYAVERFNQFLATKRYRYIENRRAKQIRKEASNLMQEGLDQELGYAQQLALLADAQFIIQIKRLVMETRSEMFDTRTSAKVGIEVKAYDNCTGEGLGTVVLSSGDFASMDDVNGMHSAIDHAIQNDGQKLLETFAQYIGGWVNNGIPYELRFYDAGGFRELRALRQQLKADASFGGDMEVVSADDFQKLNCTFKRKPDELADKVLDVADNLPEFKTRNMDVKYMYGRQISFAPRTYKIPGLPEQAQTQRESAAPPAATKAAAPAKRTIKTPVRRKK